MTKVSLNSIITEKFISKLAAAGEKISSAPSNPLKGGSSVNLSGSLRLGAQTYATAVGALNNTLSIVNVAQATLEKLGEITDKMIEVTEKSAKRAVGPQGRRALDIEFRKLATDFKKIVEKAEIADKNFLSVEGLTELFISVGLDKETSSSIAEVFSRFMTPEDDTSLASEKVEGKKPLVIPAAAYTTRPSDSEYQIEKLTDAPLSSATAGISPTTNVFVAIDDILNQNPGDEAVFVRDLTGSLTSQGAGQLSAASQTLLAVNEQTGYSVVLSSSNPVGENPGETPQVFLLDESGAFVGQITNLGSQVQIQSVDIGFSDEIFAIQYYDSDIGRYYVDVYEVEKTKTPSSAIITPIDERRESEAILSDVKISNAGDYVAYQFYEVASEQYHVELFKLGGVGPDADLPTVTSKDSIDFGFVAGDGQVIISTTVSFGSPERDIQTYMGGAFNTLLTNVEYDAFTTLQSDDSGVGGYFSIGGPVGAGTTVGVYSADDASTVYTYDVGDDTISSLSLALNSGDSTRIDVGVVGALPDIAGDADLEMYRISFNPNSVSGRRIRSDTTQYDEILDPNRSISSRPAAYRMLNDLKALREQITENVDALSNAFKVVSDNITLVRATGLALLDIGDELTSETDAADVAESLRRRIRQSVGEALAQAENLDPIAVATLTYTSSGN